MGENHWWVIAFLSCPCHIVWIPLLLAGTSLGALLTGRVYWALAIGMTAVFVFSLTRCLREK